MDKLNKLDREDQNKKEFETINISLMRFLWDSSLFGKRNKTISRFLRNMIFLSKVSDSELKIFTSYLHRRSFKENEIIFNKGDLGIGLYIIYSGAVEIDTNETNTLVLNERDFFGELSLFVEDDLRNVKAVSIRETILLGFFQPDFAALNDEYPVIASKITSSIASIMANRIYLLGNELEQLQGKLKEYESQ